MQKFKDALIKANKLLDGGKPEKAIALYNEIISKDPKNFLVRLNKSICLIKIGKILEAIELLNQLYKEKPENVMVLRFASFAYQQINQFKVALDFLKLAVHLEPNDYEIWLELTKISSALSRYSDSAYYATQALSLNPTDPRSHNNLGGALQALGKRDAAITCYETALQLDPKNILAMSNLGSIHESEPRKALEIYEKVMAIKELTATQREELQYKMGYSHLRLGNLKQGWEFYDMGLRVSDPRGRHPQRKFSKPIWDGQEAKDKTLLIWREQGLGDELRFFGMINEAIPLFKEVIIECDERLIQALQRSFPTTRVRKQEYSLSSDGLVSKEEDFDVHLPAGSLMRFFRKDISDFKKSRSYIKSDPERIDLFKERLNQISPKPKIGICWRSGVVDSVRAGYLTKLSDWGPIFECDEYEYVNLQYGDCEQEIAEAEEFFGVKIHRWSDLDLRDDLESVFALVANLDMVISAPTAVCSMAEVVGTHAKFMYPDGWIYLGGDNYPWYPNVDVYRFNEDENAKDALTRIASDLKRDGPLRKQFTGVAHHV